MRKITLILSFLFCCGLSNADNTISLSVSDGMPGDTVTVFVSMSASDRVVAAEFSVPVLEGLSYVAGSFDDTSTGMSSSCALVNEELKVYYYSADIDKSQLGNGTLFSFKFRLGRIPGVYRILPAVVLSDSNGNALNVKVAGSDITVKAPQIKIDSEQIDFGHIAIRSTYSEYIGITNSGTTPLNVASITSSSQELTVSESSFTVSPGATKRLGISYNPSLTGDQDLTLTIQSDAIDNPTRTVTVMADTYSVNVLKVSNTEGDTDTEVSVDLYLDNMENLSAFECSLALPEGVTYVDGSFVTSDRLKNMRSFAVVEDGKLKLYSYSESDGKIQEGTGKVASFKLLLGCLNATFGLVPEGVILGNGSYVNVLSDLETGTLNVKSPLIDCVASVDMGKTSIAVFATANLQIKNNGQKDLIIERAVFDDNSFSIKEQCPIKVEPGSQKPITISYKPDSIGAYSSNLSLYTNVQYDGVVNVSISGDAFEPNYITSVAMVDSDRKGTLTVGLTNYGKVSAIEMNVYGLEEMTVDETSLSLTERCAGFKSVLSLNEDRSVKILVYSLSTDFVSGNAGELFSFAFNCGRVTANSVTVRIADIILSDEKGRNISESKENSITLSLPVPTLIDQVRQTESDVIFDITGRVVGKELESLPPGIYIRNGRKIVIR